MKMNSIESRSPFFPRSKTSQTDVQKARANQALKRNSYDRAQEIETRTSKDAKVSINDKIKDFSRIKKAADSTEPIDNSDKIAMLKAKIQAGTYEPDYDQLADRILSSEY
jgi:negative regulator of flagellin synthesis FlgM